MNDYSQPSPRREPNRLIGRLDSRARKDHPACSGLLDYFPDALIAVANVSKQGNDKHNPGEPMHHARGKSTDHADCILRHLIERGDYDEEGVRHSASLAWRALALLQEELELANNLPLPRGARDATASTQPTPKLDTKVRSQRNVLSNDSGVRGGE